MHIKFHHIYGVKNNTKEQLKEFLISKLDDLQVVKRL